MLRNILSINKVVGDAEQPAAYLDALGDDDSTGVSQYYALFRASARKQSQRIAHKKHCLSATEDVRPSERAEFVSLQLLSRIRQDKTILTLCVWGSSATRDTLHLSDRPL